MSRQKNEGGKFVSSKIPNVLYTLRQYFLHNIIACIEFSGYYHYQCTATTESMFSLSSFCLVYTT